LVERFRVSYVSSGRNLLPAPVAAGKPGPALVLADPDYDAPPPERSPGPAGSDAPDPGERFRRLPGFAREAEAVAGPLPAAAGGGSACDGGRGRPRGPGPRPGARACSTW